MTTPTQIPNVWVHILVIVFSLIWGSFLNVVAWRLLHNIPFFGKRSRCPSCKHCLAWYDLLPAVSWFLLRGRCRTCKTQISWLYPFIEIISAISFYGLFLRYSWPTFIAYAILFSALIVTIRTDIEDFVILRCFSLGIIPIGLLASVLGILPIELSKSILGASLGYGALWLTRFIFLKLTGKIGVGQGDLELLAMIGSFTGPIGCWLTLVIGSLFASVYGAATLIAQKKDSRLIPFGPFLAIGAMTVILFKKNIFLFIL